MEIYTDGSSRGNPGPGGWGFVAIFDNKTEEHSGSKAHTTNNEMELMAVIEAFQFAESMLEIDPQAKLTIYSDSTYVVQGIMVWRKSWKNNGWRTASKDPVKNLDLWMTIDAFAEKYPGRIVCKKVAGHAGHEHNERADVLATEAADRVRGV